MPKSQMALKMASWCLRTTWEQPLRLRWTKRSRCSTQGKVGSSESPEHLTSWWKFTAGMTPASSGLGALRLDPWCIGEFRVFRHWGRGFLAKRAGGGGTREVPAAGTEKENWKGTWKRTPEASVFKHPLHSMLLKLPGAIDVWGPQRLRGLPRAALLGTGAGGGWPVHLQLHCSDCWSQIFRFTTEEVGVLCTVRLCRPGRPYCDHSHREVCDGWILVGRAGSWTAVLLHLYSHVCVYAYFSSEHFIEMGERLDKQAVANRTIVFHGKVRPGTGKCVCSWPGKYESAWDALVTGSRRGNISAAVVFLPEGSKHFGSHDAIPKGEKLQGSCWCVPLYGEQKPWGCRWWTKWIANIESARREGAGRFTSSKAWRVEEKLRISQRPVKSTWDEKPF